MAWKISGDASVPVISFDGVVHYADVIASFQELAAEGIDPSAFDVLIDLRRVDRIDIDVDESHEMSRTVMALLRSGPHVRAAVVAEGDVRRDAEHHFLIRDTLTGRDPSQLARLSSFDDIDEAQAWLEEGRSLNP